MIELHRHLEGSVRIESLFEMAREYRLPMLSDKIEDLRRTYEITPQDPTSYTNFFSKIGTLRRFFIRREIIERAAREAVQDARAEGVTRLELRFSPAFLSAAGGFNPQDVSEWVMRSCRMPRIQVTFLATLSRAHPYAVNAPTIDVALGTGLFVGLDLAGYEVQADGLEYEGAFRRAREKGLGVTIHAAEHPETGANARRAVERLHANRIGHGLYTPPRDLEFLIEREIPLEMCPTSNRLLGVWDPATPHPAKEYLRRGARVTLNTDNPRIFDARLPDEFDAAGLASQKKKLDAIARRALFR